MKPVSYTETIREEINDFRSSWQKITYKNRAIYVYEHGADWFIPNAEADFLLQQGDVHFQKRIALPNPRVYRPKYETKAPALAEFWIHLTNRCNLTCKHCLFSSSPEESDMLAFETIQKHLQEAYALGCRLFIVTGGEPLVHPRFLELIETILNYEATNVVVLTNGVLVQKVFSAASFDSKRLSFQISVDGLEVEHDALRGKGTFAKVLRNAAWLRDNAYAFSFSFCVHPHNLHTLLGLIDTTKNAGATHLHLLWYFVHGRGIDTPIVSTDVLLDALLNAYMYACEHGVAIDNFEALKTQIFAPKGTVHDGSSSGRSSLALGYDGRFYPSAATVGEKELLMQGKTIAEALKSETAERIARSSVVDLKTPLRFLLGGGDLDHSFHHARTLMGDDPYEPLMRALAMEMMLAEAASYEPKKAGLCLEMGDILYTCGAHEGIAHTHANCMIATGESESLRIVKAFYHDAALEDKEDILNPVCYDEALLSHIPEALRFRGYGCGSPILEADLQAGETMLDLGSGRGVECFIASKLVGENGRVIGVDMLPSMLRIAQEGAKAVAHNLGYDNLSFYQGYLEALPLDDASVDVVTSNCVLNLSTHKRKLFAQIFRVLKEGGRLVVSDVVCDEEASAGIKNDAKLGGECIAGALSQTHLTGLLLESGFTNIRLLKRFFYREVQGHPFYSLSFEAYKPSHETYVDVMYKGEGERLILEEGIVLYKGVKTKVRARTAKALQSVLFCFDAEGNIVNQEGAACNCALPPESKPSLRSLAAESFGLIKPKAAHDCMVCKAPLRYETAVQEVACHYCNSVHLSSVTCENGHYVCDACHAKDALAVIEHLCRSSQERDMLKLFKQIRAHPSIPKHGPEHHAMVPAIIVTAYRNSGGKLPENALKTALSRGSSVIGGACGFLGMCGAAAGVGIGFAILLEASPVAKAARSQAQKVTHAVLGKIAEYEAARCCNREVWTALTIASSLSEDFLHVRLWAEEQTKCDQKKFNAYCYGKKCPIF